ncbi:MAG: replication initiation protein [Saprospiraceae bacterium]|nr:replication initiation protein [Saprospiraceae bacterium]MCF8250510.1 replication initiation protein [Saprospiraceae bacterium]MCF8279650.1 replication initiation protein [Bacteroidales bacterium]MCF8312436.1 replication initiation protein [Saprospiraceae bacterium]MCF8440747.1 replication initiation protein [Saprospiraceae bacterium]
MGKRRRKSGGIVVIKKANQLIESRYRFDIWETRFFLSILSQIRRDDNDFQVYRVWYKDVIRAFSLKSNQSYHLLREAAKSIMSKSFFVSYEKDGTSREVQYHILRKIDYLKDGNESKGRESQEYIDVTIEQEMKPFFLQLQRNFTAYDLRNVVKLGAYPIRVYELLKQYESIGERTMDIEEIKRMFEITKEYQRFPDFFRWVVSPAIKEINSHTDLLVTDCIKVKEGKKVVSLRFIFRRKPDEDVPHTRSRVVPKPLELPFQANELKTVAEVSDALPKKTKDLLFNKFQQEVVQQFGVTATTFLELLDGCTEKQVGQAIRVTRRAKVNNQIKTSVPGFFINALRNGYTDPKEEQMRREVQEVEKGRVVLAIRQEVDTLREEAADLINEQIKLLTVSQPDITTTAIDSLKDNPYAKLIVEKKEKTAKKELELEDYRRDKILRDLVRQAIVEQHPDTFATILSEYEPKIKLLEEKIKNVSR